MSTYKDFENAPTGATATRADGSRAMKVNDGDQYWITQNGYRATDKHVEQRGFALDRLAPTTAREALDLAWELAHEVREGQVIPKGARYLDKPASGLKEFIASHDFKISPGIATRTLEPLPEPEPDWLDAPAVLAALLWCPEQKVWLPSTSGHWKCADFDNEHHWSDLRDVTPLYPKGQDA